jgi:hypothetical protein
MTEARKNLIAYIALCLTQSGRTMDEDSWATIMAQESLAAIERHIGERLVG